MGIKSNDGVFLPVRPVGIGEKRGKHRAVFHVVPVYEVVATALIAGGRQERNTALGILSVKVPP